MPLQNFQSKPDRFAVGPMVVFVGAVILFLLIGNFLFGNLREGIREEAQRNIASVGVLKANLIHQWLDDRIADARTLSENSFVSREATSWLRGGARDVRKRRQLVERLQAFLEGHHYYAIVLYDAGGRVMLSAGKATEDSDEMRGEARRVAASGKPEFIDLHRSLDAAMPVVLGFMNPLREGNQLSGTIYLVEDPQRYLFPLVHEWPRDSATAETQLVREEGDRVLFLDQLRHREEPPLGFSLPLDTPQLAAAMALRGSKGVLEHALDYRGKPVLSYAISVDGTPWTLISKVDEDEAYRMVDQMRRMAAYVAVFIFALVGAWLWQWFRREQAAVQAAVLQERVRADTMQLESEKRFRTVFEHTALPMARNSLKGEFIEVNDAWCDMFGYSREQVLARHMTWQQITHPDDIEAGASLLHRLIDDEITDIRMERRYIRSDGEVLWGSLQESLVRDEKGQPDYVISAIQDITERKLAEQQISFMAYHDRLTGLPNRALLFDRLSQAMSHAKRDGKHVALLFVDLDGFKAVNDNYGHEAGDVVLRVAAQRLLACVRAVDTVARFGGDEFAIILGTLDAPHQARSVADKIVQAFSIGLSLPDGKECQVGASVGISIYPEHGSAMDSLMTAADEAMYASKSRGKNTYSFFRKGSLVDPDSPWMRFDDSQLVGVDELDEEHRNLVELGNRLNDALKRDEPADAILRMFDDLLAAITHHFETEIRYMTTYRYPEQKAHEADHARLMNEALHLKRQFSEGRELSALHAIKDWLTKHIAYDDRNLAAYLKQRGVE
jgi:diguanylate cyclase (GGDEF)-like protein/PAS domain S-box-containing protein/hemerythrin-like metal-binding protein